MNIQEGGQMSIKEYDVGSVSEAPPQVMSQEDLQRKVPETDKLDDIEMNKKYQT